MLVLTRKEGQKVIVTDKAGNTLIISVYDIRGVHSGKLRMSFDDPKHNFDIQRPDRYKNGSPENM